MAPHLVVATCVTLLAAAVMAQELCLSTDDMVRKYGGHDSVRQILEKQLVIGRTTPLALRFCLLRDNPPKICGGFIHPLQCGIRDLQKTQFQCGRDCHPTVKLVRDAVVNFMRTEKEQCRLLMQDLNINIDVTKAECQL